MKVLGHYPGDRQRQEERSPVENFTPPALLSTTEPKRTTASGNLGGEADRLELAGSSN